MVVIEMSDVPLWGKNRQEKYRYFKNLLPIFKTLLRMLEKSCNFAKQILYTYDEVARKR